MSSNKRRKIDVGPGTQMLSAAALRRRLLEKQASTATAEVAEGSGTEPAENARGDSNGSASPKAGESARRVLPRTSMTKEASRTPEQVLLGMFGAVVEDEFETTEPAQDLPKRRVFQLSSVNPTKMNLQRRPSGISVLDFADSSERLVILGSYGVKVKSGEATIYGATLPSSDLIHWIHASHCHALPVLRCSEKSSIELHPHPAANDLRELEKLSPVFGNLWNDLDSGKAVDKQTWQILASSADGPKKAMLQDLKSPAEWNRKISGLVKTPQHDNPVLLICGPKSSGKSTFARIVSNRLLTHRGGTKKRIWPVVAVLDIDPGQPEFSPPGSISLVTLDEPNLSPPFCHPAPGSEHLMRSHAIASITPASDVEHYKRCVLDLFSHYKAMATNCPLIINTPGWIQGSGLVLLRDLIAAISPSEVLYMSEDGPEDTVEGLRSACHSAVLTTLPSQSSEFTSRTALHLRHMQAMSYFHLAASGPGDSTRWDPAPLTSTPPWLVRYSGTDSGILAVACYGYQPLPELLAETIDGTVVAVVEVEQQLFAGADGQQHDELHPHIERTPEQIPYLRGARADRPLDPARSRCLGLALVRGVDRNRALLALSTPLQMDVLASATMRDGKALVLVAGKFDAPTWAYTEDHYNRAHRRRAGGAVGEGIEDDEESASGHIPWVERLHGGQKRAVGSRVWRVRRDLGRSNSAGGGGD